VANPDDRLRPLLERLQRQTPLWQAFLLAHRQIVDQMAEQMLTDHDLPLEWFDVLVHLATEPDMAARQKDLRDRLLLSESGVSRLLVRMEKAGHLRRSPAGEDRRGVKIAITDKGREALTAATASHLDMVAALFTDRLTATDHAALKRVLAKLLVVPVPGEG
jgi:DNA-binding MarR family transcriptional regulator